MRQSRPICILLNEMATGSSRLARKLITHGMSCCFKISNNTRASWKRVHVSITTKSSPSSSSKSHVICFSKKSRTSFPPTHEGAPKISTMLPDFCNCESLVLFCRSLTRGIPSLRRLARSFILGLLESTEAAAAVEISTTALLMILDDEGLFLFLFLFDVEESTVVVSPRGKYSSS